MRGTNEQVSNAYKCFIYIIDTEIEKIESQEELTGIQDGY